MRLLIILFLLLFSSLSVAEISGVFNTTTQRKLAYSDFLNQLSQFEIIVMGDSHYNVDLQLTESSLINDVVRAHKKKKFALMWEFLNISDQDKIDVEFKNIKPEKPNAENFVKTFLGVRAWSYIPLIETTRKLGGAIIGIDLPRDLKQRLLVNEMKALNISYEGNYFERFRHVVTPSRHNSSKVDIREYFKFHCLTDQVMSQQILKKHKDLSFVLVGAFHSDFNDGLMKRLKALSSQKIVNVKLVDENEFGKSGNKNQILVKDKKYGTIADFVVFVK